MRAAVYARISSDREGAGLGVARQLGDCKALAKKHGWTIVATHQDNDISAWSGKARPGYDALLAAVRNGLVDVVVCWHTDRLTRSARDLEDVIDACERHDVAVHAVQSGGPIDLTTAAGRLQARIAGAVARHESDQKAERIRRKHQELAEAGKPASLHCSYGYNKDGTLNEAEATIIRDLARRLLSGESIRSLTYWLNENNVPTKKGNSTWSASTVRQILTSGRICGWREWTPRTPPKDEKQGWDGKPRRGWGCGKLVAEGSWDPIISRETTDQIRALVSDPSRKSTKRRHYLLSAGILRCGKCGKAMNHKVEVRYSRVAQRDADGAVVKDAKGRTVRAKDLSRPPTKASRYACIKQSGRGCGGTSVACPELDRWVSEAVFEALSGCDLSTTDPGPTESEVAAVRRRIDDAAARLIQVGLDHADGKITRDEWLAMRKRIEANIAAMRDSLPQTDARSVLLDLPSDTDALRSAWSEMTLDRQRSIVQAVIDRVVIHPSSQPVGRPKFDPSRVEIVWRG